MRLYRGDCLEVLPMLEAESIDSIITDPPYGLEFMGKDWDHGVPGIHFWAECLRVAKPGAMLLAFGGTRTHHRLMCAIEDAGWEIRDCLMYLYGSGFPKSHDISKAIDKAAGAEREVVSTVTRTGSSGNGQTVHQEGGDKSGICHITAPATSAAQLWDGWGTALKPAWEPIVLAMKPRDGTFVQNALEYGVAGLWVDGCRVATDWDTDPTRRGWQGGDATNCDSIFGNGGAKRISYPHNGGRWPANLLLDEEAARLLDEQGGERLPPWGKESESRNDTSWFSGRTNSYGKLYRDTGGASRFFYTAKASRSEREQGLIGHLPCLKCGGMDTETHIDPKTGREVKCIRNGHPTVKPLSLCRWLCRLTKTPTGGVVLDPFMGSGSIGMAAVQEGRDFVGIEIEQGSYQVAECRIGQAKPEAVQLELVP